MFGSKSYLLQTQGTDIFRMKGIWISLGKITALCFKVHMLFEGTRDRPWKWNPKKWISVIGRNLNEAQLKADFQEVLFVAANEILYSNPAIRLVLFRKALRLCNSDRLVAARSDLAVSSASWRSDAGDLPNTDEVCLYCPYKWWSLHSLAFSQDGQLLAAGGQNGQVKIWLCRQMQSL